MLIGVIAGIVSGALWGLTFVAAKAVEPYSAWDITVARYIVFGLVSLGLMAVSRRFQPRGLSRPIVVAGLLLGATAYSTYFLAIAYAVKWAGPAIPPLIVGLMPVALAVLGNWHDKGLSSMALAGPLALIALGVLVVNGSALTMSSLGSDAPVGLGVVSAVVALIIWVLFGWANSVVMRAADAPDALRWTCLQGLGALIGNALLLPATDLLRTGGLTMLATSADGHRLIAWAVVMGAAGSWLAAWTWIVASRRLPIAMTAQLVVFETIFGLIDGFLFDHRWPVAAEWIGSVLQLAGVMASVALFTRTKTEPAAAAPHAEAACATRQ